MSDREMLESAARAAGISYDKEIAEREDQKKSAMQFGLWLKFDREPSEYDRRRWNPLTDDGDALRLAVKLNIPVFPYEDETSTGTSGVVAKNWGGKEANTRRAIVRAAAEIGRAME